MGTGVFPLYKACQNAVGVPQDAYLGEFALGDRAIDGNVNLQFTEGDQGAQSVELGFKGSPLGELCMEHFGVGLSS